MLGASSLRRTPVGTLMIIKITSGLNSVRRHEGRKEKGLEHESTIEDLQVPDESPSQFCEWLCEAFHLYTPFNPEVAENQKTINEAFFSQAQWNTGENFKSLRGLLV
jgi:hypothetical protein